jgi:putative thioredoxin
MTSDYVVDVNETDFEFEVLNYSQTTTVIVDFWAPWSNPSKDLSPLLEHLAQEARGAFRLAKVNVEDNKSLTGRYNVRNVPVVKAFQNGQVVAEFSGAQPEPTIREFIRNIAPSPSDLLVEKAASLLQMRQWATAEKTCYEALELTPEQPDALLILAKTLLAQGKQDAASQILRAFPASKEYSAAQSLLPLVEALSRRESPADTLLPLDAAYANNLRLVARGNLPAAMDGLLDILRENKNYRGGEVRKVFLGLLEMLGEEDPQTREYRSELASTLF